MCYSIFFIFIYFIFRLHVGQESLFTSSESEFKHKKSVSSVQDIFVIDENNISHSPSHITESTEQSAPVTFDMSNRVCINLILYPFFTC